jgi:hypothetical protein
MVGFGSDGEVGAAAGGGGGGGTLDWEQLWQQLQWEMTLGNSEEWEQAGPIRRGFRQVRSLG